MSISTGDDVGELLILAGQALTSSLSPSSSVSSSSSPSTINITTTSNTISGSRVGNVVVGVNNSNPTLRQYSSSHQRRFHRRFPAIDPHEKLIDWYSCALVADILLQGYLYISENYFAFYSNILGYKTQLLIPICDVISVTKEKTAKIFPNAVGICTDQTKYVFGSLLSRESTFRLMQEVWKSTLIQVVSLPYFSPVIQLDKIIKRNENDILIEKPEEVEEEDDEDDDDDDEEEEDDENTEETESAVSLTSEQLNPTKNINNNNSSSNSGVNKKINTQSSSGLIVSNPCIETLDPETIKLVTSEITSIQKILSTTHHQRPNVTDSSGSDSDANRDPVVYQDTCKTLINDSTTSTNFRLSLKKRQSITLTHYGSNWIIKAKNWLTTTIRPYQRILWNQITDTTRLLVMTTTLLIMLFLSALIFLYRVEQVHSELLSLQQNTETNDFNQVQSKQLELRKEIKRLVNSLEEKTAELSLLKERIEEILNSYSHLSTCST